MTQLQISVIVVSRHRPQWLKRCLTAIAQLDYPQFETIVVACPAGARVAEGMKVRCVQTFDDANISAARNTGVSHASGDVVAFIDDDAVPEPTWLWHLSKAFTAPEVAQAGGITLGRNGISVQHAAARVGPTGQTQPVSFSKGASHTVSPLDNQHPRLHGTNMAIRRDIVIAQGGFDTRFTFYLDETDLSFRISKSGGKTMFVPMAVVHHASGASRFRDDARTPRSVYDIAASAGVFHRKHCPDDERLTAQASFIAERRVWLLGHMTRGTLTPDQTYRLIKELKAGYAEGTSRPPSDVQTWPETRDFKSDAEENSRNDVYLVSSRSTQKQVLAKAKAFVTGGYRVSVFDYRPTARFHKVAYVSDGYWHHTGGIFGREDRSEPIFQKSTLPLRIQKTLDRLSGIRCKSGSLIKR